MDISTVKIVRTALTVGILVVALFGKLVSKAAPGLMMACAIIVLALFVADIIISILFWKCPGCGRPLRHRSLWPHYCDKCGEYLG